MSLQAAMELPKDLEKGLVVVTAFGEQEMRIENHRGILAFETECICVLHKVGRITIVGKELKICTYNQEEIHIKGKICEILYS